MTVSPRSDVGPAAYEGTCSDDSPQAQAFEPVLIAVDPHDVSFQIEWLDGDYAVDDRVRATIRLDYEPILPSLWGAAATHCPHRRRCELLIKSEQKKENRAMIRYMPHSFDMQQHLEGRTRSQRTGKVLVLPAISLPMLFGMLGLVVDGGMLMIEHRQLQQVARMTGCCSTSDERCANRW